MSYNVYTAEYVGKPNHVAIYIETNPNALQVADRGHLYHVTGNILQGMIYDPRDSRDPMESASFVPGTKTKIGTIAKEDLARFEPECCRAVPAPPAQMTLGGKRLDLLEKKYT
jgi:hypothetical protein